MACFSPPQKLFKLPGRLKTIVLLLSVFLFLFNLTGLLLAGTYYVDQATGNNQNDGFSREAPLETIQSAHDHTAPGDRVIVLSGSYQERVRITRPGRSGQPIRFEAEGLAVCRGFTIETDYIQVTGFEITATPDDWADGAGVFVSGSFCEISANYIHDVSRRGINLWSPNPDSPDLTNCLIKGNRILRAGHAGIEINGRNHLVEGNEISHTLQRPPGWINPPDWADADGLRFFGTGHIIRKNRILDISLQDPENAGGPHIDCMQTWGPASNIIIEQNYCRIPDEGMQGLMIEEINSPLSGLVIRNNLIYAFRQINAFDSEGLKIINNTFASQPQYGRASHGVELRRSPSAVVKNNLFYNVGQAVYPYLYLDLESQSGLDAGYNCHFMGDGQAPAGFPRPNDLWQVDPKVANFQENDFHLLSDSPLINAGAPIPGLALDFDGRARPQGSGFDIGAFEFNNNPRSLSAPKGLKLNQ